MAELYVNHNGANAKVKELYVNYNGSNKKVKELYESNGTSWVKIFNSGVTPTGTFSWRVVAGHYKETYHFNPQVTFNNGLHINIPWTFDGGVSGSSAEADFELSIPVNFNQVINFTDGQPIWGLSTALSYSGNYIKYDALPKLYLNSSGYGGIEEAFRIDSPSMYTFNPKETNAMQTISLSASCLVLGFWLSDGHSTAHGSTFAMDIPNEALYILSQGARIPFIFG
jgi:hypothetical protein